MLVKKITGESEIYKVFKKREKKLVFQKQFRQKHFFEAFFVIDNNKWRKFETLKPAYSNFTTCSQFSHNLIPPATFSSISAFHGKTNVA